MTKQERYKLRHKSQGLCIFCPKPSVPETFLCTSCAEISQVRRQGYKKDRRCTRCSAPLDPDADGGNVTCINCRETSHETVNLRGFRTNI